MLIVQDLGMSPLAGTPEAVELISEGLGGSGPDRGRGGVFSNNVLEDEDDLGGPEGVTKRVARSPEGGENLCRERTTMGGGTWVVVVLEKVGHEVTGVT